MSFSNEWDEAFKANTHLSVWPWSDLVSFFNRYIRPIPDNFRVLELGCGAGANIPFFRELKIDYYGLDGSANIISKLKKKFPELEKKLKVNDFTQGISFEQKFNLIFDRSAVPHNTTKGIQKCLDLVYEKLESQGKYIGIDWFSTDHSEFGKGKKEEDEFTFSGYQEGQFAKVGRVHFSNKFHLLDLFKKFKILRLEHKTVKKEIPTGEPVAGYWNFVLEKK